MRCATCNPGEVLDFRYFVTKVEPILAKPGADGKACVFCHASHVIFKLAPPNAEGIFSDQDSKENYKYAMRVVDITNPDRSLMVIKPTRPTDSAGNVGDYLATHNGGQRWRGNESSEQYRTILEWVQRGPSGGGQRAKIEVSRFSRATSVVFGGSSRTGRQIRSRTTSARGCELSATLPDAICAKTLG